MLNLCSNDVNPKEVESLLKGIISYSDWIDSVLEQMLMQNLMIK